MVGIQALIPPHRVPLSLEIYERFTESSISIQREDVSDYALASDTAQSKVYHFVEYSFNFLKLFRGHKIIQIIIINPCMLYISTSNWVLCTQNAG